MSAAKNKAIINRECVACGHCVKSCPLNAVTVYKGMYAAIDEQRCAGCGKCADVCPASVISLIPREVKINVSNALV